MPTDWSPTCEIRDHRGRAIPATDVYTEKRSNIRYYLCSECSVRVGGTLYKRGWKWAKLPPSTHPYTMKESTT